jgi:deoxyadenosine/deoxycytidine kinase
MNEKYKFIVVEGPIGVGKTTLARKLANNLNSELLLEKFLENPFLEKFYKDIDKYALSTQLHFLLQRKADLSKLDSVGSNNKNYVSDYFINKDKLFAKTVLSRNEFELYTKIFDALNIMIPKPDLIIYLQAEPDILLERIKLRGNGFEKNITKDYLQKITDAYTQFFYSYKESPLLIINTSRVDVNKSHDYVMLLDEISKDIKGKNYFNPSTI